MKDNPQTLWNGLGALFFRVAILGVAMSHMALATGCTQQNCGVSSSDNILTRNYEYINNRWYYLDVSDSVDSVRCAPLGTPGEIEDFLSFVKHLRYANISKISYSQTISGASVRDHLLIRYSDTDDLIALSGRVEEWVALQSGDQYQKAGALATDDVSEGREEMSFYFRSKRSQNLHCRVTVVSNFRGHSLAIRLNQDIAPPDTHD